MQFLLLSVAIIAFLLDFCSGFSVMVVGDSISHGYNADYTWRYRLWQWFQANHIAVDFVGLYIGNAAQPQGAAPSPPPLQGQSAVSTPVSTNGSYAAPFNSNHFCLWGQQLAQDKLLIQEMIATYQPNYLLVELGFNGIAWFVSDEAGTIASMVSFIANARAAKPDFKFAIPNIPQRTFLGAINPNLVAKTTKYNMLAAAIPSWSTTESPIALVNFAGSYSCNLNSCPTAHDDLHPNILGEYQIAHAFTTTLHKLQSRKPRPKNPYNTPYACLSHPGNVHFEATDSGMVATWTHVFGAYSYDAKYTLSGATSFNLATV